MREGHVDWAAAIRERLAGAGLTGSEEADIVDELTDHLEDRHAELCARRSSPDEAMRLTLDELAAEGLLAHAVRAARRSPPPEAVPLGAASGRGVGVLRGDFRYALRMLRRNPVFTIAVMLTLSLGIGASTAIFTVVDAVLLRSLPFADADRLVQVWEDTDRYDFPTHDLPTSPANFEDWRSQEKSFEGMGAFRFSPTVLTGVGDPDQLWLAQVTPGLFPVLGVPPAMGRFLREEEGRPGGASSVLIGDGIWRTRLGADPAVIGRTLVLDGKPYTIVGVMPRGFRFPLPTMYPILRQMQVDLWTPLIIDPSAAPRGARALAVVARLAPEATLASAGADMTLVHARLAEEYPGNVGRWTVHVVPLSKQVRGDLSRPLLMLLACVSLVLLIACMNVANLLLARGEARRHEIAIRAALGASRGRLAAQLLVESLLLSLGGGALGLLLAWAGVGPLTSLLPAGFPRASEIAVDGRVALFALGATLLTGVLFGTLPSLRLARAGAPGVMRESGRGNTQGRRGRRADMLLVGAQVALATVLLIGAGLLLRSFFSLAGVDPGFRTDHLIGGNLTLSAAKYPDAERRRAFYERVGERVRGLAGVEAAAVSGLLPFTGVEEFDGFTIEGGPAEATEDRPPARMYIVDPHYFETTGMPLVRGRALQPTDRSDSPPVVVINASFARRYFPGGDPIGRRLSMENGPPVSIVGVVGDVRFSALDAEPAIEFYFPLTQADWGTSWLVARTAGDPKAMIQSLRRAVQDIDPDQPLSRIATMDRLISDSMAQRRLQMVLLGAFAALALVLAVTGLYGVLAHATARRAAEMGVRLALGARPGEVVAMVVGKGMRAVAAGAVLGLAGALAFSRVIASLLYGVSARDPLTFIVVPLVLGSIALVAAWIPARRAARIDPVITLRFE